MSSSKRSEAASRRSFLKTSALATAGVAVGSLAIGRSAHAAGSDVLKIGLIGCGGRGTGAAGNAMTVDKNTKLVAMGDAFEDRLQTSLEVLKKKFPEQVAVDSDHCFSGFDAYKKVIESSDVVLLAESPHFRPSHLRAAIEAGKHVFCEKPVAVDAPGIRSVLESSELAAKKGLNLVSGLCWRYHTPVRETMQRLLDGAIGDVVTMQETYLTGTLWHRDPKPGETWTPMQYQMRNWYYFAWLSGDFNTEQHVHSLDKAQWMMRDEPPVRAWGLGGRQVRTDPKWGDIYDHHAVVYEYENGTRLYSFCRQEAGCFGDVSDQFQGTKGRAIIVPKFRIEGPNAWQYEGAKCNMYEAEHQAMFESIRAGKAINNGVYMARSTMMAILGRMVNYTGKAITWEEAMNSKQDLSPKAYAWDAEPPTVAGADGKYPVAMPGVTPFA
jgi:predicted dehydrogenase